MSVNTVTKARARFGAVVIGSPVSDGGRASAPDGAVVKRLAAPTATVNPGAIAAQTSVEVTLTINGVALGDVVVAQPATATVPQSGITWDAYVSGTNTVKVRLSNVTTASLTPTSATWTIMFFQVTA